MTLSSRVYDTTQIPIYEVRINNVLIVPSNPTLSTGTPAVTAIRFGVNYDSPVPTVDLEVNRIPTWITRGMAVTIDAGYASNGGATRELVRVFTGGVLMRGDEDPEYFRTQCFANGATASDGSQITATASLIGGPTVWPPIPSGQYIDFSIDNGLINDATKAASIASRELTRRARIPQRPSGDVVRRTLRCVGDLYGAFRSYQIPAKDYSGQTVKAAIGTVLAASGVSAYDTSLVPAYTLASSGATIDRAPGSQHLAKLMQIDGCTAQQLASGVVLVKPTDLLPAPSANWTYSTTNQSYARIIDTTSELRIPFNPLIDIGQTIQLDVDFLDVSGRYFVYGHRWEFSDQGAWSYLDLRGGGDYGGTIGINPVASFTWKVEREVIGDRVYAIVTFDASASYDPDGTIASYAWSDDQTTSPEIATITTVYATVLVDPSVVTTDWNVTLTVTDNSGLTGAITQTIPIDATSTAVQLPAMYVAMNNKHSASPDGGQTWNDFSVAASTSISVGARPADGVNFGQACFGRADGTILRTLDACVSFATVASSLGSAVNDIQWDWRDPTRVWALTDSGRVYLSTDSGATFSLYDDIRTVTYVSGAATSGALGNKLGLPASDGIYVFGGDGAGTPLIAYDPVVGSHQWVHQAFTGDLATDTPADATMRIVDVIAPGDGHTTIILAWASGGGGSLVAIYDSTSAPGTSAAYTRATGLTAGLKNGRVILADAPITGTLRYALFGDRDVWYSTDCIAYTQRANVLPSGVTPNHGLFLSDVLTGLPGFQGVFVLACENAGATLGIYKSVDGLTTVSALRPATGFPAWPSSSKAKKISIGAPVKTATSASGSLFIMQSPDSTGTSYARRVAQLLGSSTWSLVANPGAASQNPMAVLKKAGSYLYRIVGSVTIDSGLTSSTQTQTGQLQRSTDGGATWSDVGPSPVNSGTTWWGVVSVTAAADGTLYLIASVDVASTDVAFPAPAVYQSTDDGATWTKVYEDTTKDGSYWRRMNSIACHPINAQQIAILGSGNFAASVRSVSWYSSDAGSSFTDSLKSSPSQLLSANEAIRILYFENGRVVAFVDQDVLYSDDNMSTWTVATYSFAVGYGQQDVIALGRTGTACLIMRATSNPPKIYRSQDYGANWSLLWTGPSSSPSRAFFAYDQSADVLYVGTNSAAATGRVYAIQDAATVTSPTAIDLTLNLDSLLSGVGDTIAFRGMTIA